MFYKPSNGHGLPQNPYNAIISPRPIGWISTQDNKGQKNLAPYSFFNATAYVPPQVMFCSTSSKEDQNNTKDSVANIRATGVFCINIVGFEMRKEMNASSIFLPKDEDEFTFAGLTAEQCKVIDCPRVAGTPAALECELNDIITLRGESNYMVLGEVIGIHLKDECINNGRFDVTTYQPIGRLGYRDYVKVSNLFELQRPND
ncbi:MAG: flavin reductase family protein [Aestuariivita sp.]|nr:flavin reductase family protein [Aestuariivita sp.]